LGTNGGFIRYSSQFEFAQLFVNDAQVIESIGIIRPKCCGVLVLPGGFA
jgi:hypothetical protein